MRVRWADASIESLTADYDAVVLSVQEDAGPMRLVRCEGYIGYSLGGFWDEVIVEDAALFDRHEAIDRCTQAIASRIRPGWGDTGNAARNTRQWRALIVKLIDGASIEIVAAAFSVDGLPLDGYES